MLLRKFWKEKLGCQIMHLMCFGDSGIFFLDFNFINLHKNGQLLANDCTYTRKHKACITITCNGSSIIYLYLFQGRVQFSIFQ